MLERQPGKGIQVQLTLDDAFADIDDQPFEFSSAAVRQHLAEQAHWVTVDQATDTNSYSASVVSCVSQSHTHDLSDVSESSDELSNVSLTVPETQTGLTFQRVTREGGLSSPCAPSQVASAVVTRIADGAAGSDGTQRIETPSPTPSAQDLPTMTASTSLQSVEVSSRSTAFQKVVSKTRPYFLPPKSRKEDKKHMADWEAMMIQSRAAEEKRRNALQERRLARELRIEQSIHVWESEIVPDWRVVHRDPDLRKVWWNGIPTKLRASMWERAAGNALTLSKDSYRSCLSRAKRALSSGVFPKETLQAIEDDILVTLPALHIFHPENGPLYQDLKDLLCAWVVARADEGLGYTPGTSKIAAMILVNMSAPQGFVVLRNLLERHCLRSFYTSSEEDIEAYYRIFDTLLADSMPKIYFNFKQHQISPAAYLPSWLMPLFLDHLPFEACARLWDVVILEGDSFLFRAALAVLAALEPRLFFPERQELLELLNGENKAAIDVARRDGRALDGGKYEIYGIDEETLWDRIESMNEWWRETTWRRLTQRELPDL
ncbi:rab-GTPase-TBC domain-containing protein [Boletus edulis]|nr:rab-GTPase-TBC domain-containing protein [Boletus edulis]